MSDGEEHLDMVEMLNAMASSARITRAYYEGLVEAGFTESEALRLTAAYVRASWGRASEPE